MDLENKYHRFDKVEMHNNLENKRWKSFLFFSFWNKFTGNSCFTTSSCISTWTSTFIIDIVGHHYTSTTIVTITCSTWCLTRKKKSLLSKVELIDVPTTVSQFFQYIDLRKHKYNRWYLKYNRFHHFYMVLVCKLKANIHTYETLSIHQIRNYTIWSCCCWSFTILTCVSSWTTTSECISI